MSKQSAPISAAAAELCSEAGGAPDSRPGAPTDLATVLGSAAPPALPQDLSKCHPPGTAPSTYGSNAHNSLCWFRTAQTIESGCIYDSAFTYSWHSIQLSLLRSHYEPSMRTAIFEKMLQPSRNCSKLAPPIDTTEPLV